MGAEKKVNRNEEEYMTKSAGMLGAVLLGMGLWMGTARAEEATFFGTERAAAVLNVPSIMVTAGKSAAAVVQPGIEYLYDLGGEGRIGTSAALWTFTNDDVPLVQLRGGYVADYLPYASLPIDLRGITQRYLLPVLPEMIESWLRAGPLDLAWSAVGKYGTVGPWMGYNLDQEEDGNDDDGGLVGGVSVGAKFTF